MATPTHHTHFSTDQSAALQGEPSPTDLALVAAHLIRIGGRKLKEQDNPYADAAEAAYALWSTCNTLLQSKRKPTGGVTEQIRQVRRQQLKALGVTEPAAYPVELRQFLILARCPGRSHPDRLAKFRAWRKSLGESGDVSQCEPIDNFWQFAGQVVGFREWLKSERSKSSKRDRTPKKIE